MHRLELGLCQMWGYLKVRDDDLGLGHVPGALVPLVSRQGPLARVQRGEDQDEQDHEDGQQQARPAAGLAPPTQNTSGLGGRAV